MSWLDTKWPYRQGFRIDNSFVDEDLTDFPVTINLLPASGHLFHWDLINSPSGVDIRFADAEGNECNFEIEKCDIENHILIAHVKVPVVSGLSTEQLIYMYYGNPNAVAVSDAFKRATWNSGYALVCHMTEKTGNMLDSTSNALESSEVTGDRTNATFINNNFQATSFSHRIDFDDAAPIRDLGTMTVEMLAHIDVVSDSKGMYEKGNFYFETVSTDRKLQFTADWSTTDGRWKTDDVIWTAANEEHHVTVAYDRGDTANNPTFYVDGIEKGNTELSTPNGTIVSESGNNIVIGNRNAEFFEWRGELDELRISNVVRSSGWMRASARSVRGQMMQLPGTLEYAPMSGVGVSGWWNSNWNYRQLVSNLENGSVYTSGFHYLRASVDLVTLASEGKLNPHYDDLRVVRQNASGQLEIPRYIASGVSPAWIYFPCETNIPSGLDFGQMQSLHYYIYYGNQTPATNAPTYTNWNCPQAPYGAAIQEGAKTPSGYYDKFFLRCNDASGPFLRDWSEHLSGNGRPSGTSEVQYDEPGRLDTCIFVPGTGVQGFRIANNIGLNNHLLNPSGHWFFECWLRPADINRVQNYFISRPEDLSDPYEQWGILLYGAGSAGSMRSRERTYNLDITDSRIAGSGDWIYYRTMWHDGVNNRQSWVATSGMQMATSKNVTSFVASVDRTTPAWIGPYLTSNEEVVTEKGFHGWLEQIRFGPWYGDLAPGGINTDWTAPYWVECEYTTYMNTEEVNPDAPPPTVFDNASGIVGGFAWGLQPIPIVILGGRVLASADPDKNRVALAGGYLLGPTPKDISATMGGYINAIQLTTVPTVFIGGLASGLYQKNAYIGGYIVGHPDTSNFAEQRDRTLVKAVSNQVEGQDLNIDAQIVFKAINANEFNAQVSMEATDFSTFMSKVNATKYRTPPSVVITAVTPASGELINGARQVTVTASGTLGDGNEWKHAYIDFGDPISSVNPLRTTENGSISGFTTGPVWTTTHDYSASGVYSIVARGIDNFGMVGTDVYMLNLASGLIAGTDYPLLKITATPRSGWVPESVLISFTAQASGIGSLNTPTDSRILWNFGNRETSQQTNPQTYYHSPGLYAPTLRWKYINTNGQTIWVADTLLIGYNR